MPDLVQIFRLLVFYLTWFLVVIINVATLVQCVLQVVTWLVVRTEPDRPQWNRFHQRMGVTLALAVLVGTGMGAFAYQIMPRMILSIGGQLGVLLINLVAARVFLCITVWGQSILSDLESTRSQLPVG